MANILIVDDDISIIRLLGKYLEPCGHACRSADGVAAAKVVLAKTPMDLILSDVDMPGESGFDLIRYVNASFPDTPMVMVSVIDDPQKAKEALALGVYGYIIKPFTRNIVLINVENALVRRRLEVEKKAHLNSLHRVVQERTRSLNDQVKFLQTLIDAIPNPIFYKNREGVIQGCNQAFASIHGLEKGRIVGKTTHDLAPREIADKAIRYEERLFREGGALDYETKVVSAEGNLSNVIINKAIYSENNGTSKGLIGVMSDISDRKAAEEALRMSQEKLRLIVDNIGIGVAMISPEMEVLWLNGQMNKWFPGIHPEDRPVCFRSFPNPPHGEPCGQCPTIRALKEGKRCETTIRTFRPEGERHFRMIASPIRDQDAKVVAAIELVEDITQKLVLEAELRQSQKLEAIGQLAAGIAHEINTPIQYVGDNTRFLEDAFDDVSAAMGAFDRLLTAVNNKDVPDGLVSEVQTVLDAADIDYLSKEIPSAIEQSLEGIRRVSKIVQAMRSFSHPGTDRKEYVDLNQSMESTITVARNEWKYVAELETDLADDMPAVPCFPGEMNQVFLNLIINAAHAISDATDGGRKGRGTITVTSRRNGDSVCISIRDTGTGIPETIRERIFDPFFTTKPVGRGTGQGLAIARNVIVEKHAGTLRFDTENGKGTTFFIDLPLSDGVRTDASDEA